MRFEIVAAVALAVALTSCHQDGVRQQITNVQESLNQPSVGVATMDNDGTIVLRLRAEGDGRTVAESELRIKPKDPNYDSTLQHLGGLKAGETKLVPPWPDHPQAQPATEKTCEAARAEALQSCAQYTDVGRDRCDAKVKMTYESCLKQRQ